MNKYILEICSVCWNLYDGYTQKLLENEGKYQRVSCMHYYLENKKISKQKKLKAKLKYLDFDYLKKIKL